MQPTLDSLYAAPKVIPARNPGGVGALLRGLAILDAFLGTGASCGLAELTRLTGLPKSSVLRSLGSLERAGYVVRLDAGRYQLGARVMLLGDAYRANFRLEEHVLPVLRALAEMTGETAAFQIREQDQRLTLFRVDSPQAVRVVENFATLQPLGNTSTGLVLTQSRWDEEVSRGRARVYATAGLFNPQTGSMATAIFGPEGRMMGSLTLSGPIERMVNADHVARAVQMAEVATRLSVALGASLSLQRPAPELIRP